MAELRKFAIVAVALAVALGVAAASGLFSATTFLGPATPGSIRIGFVKSQPFLLPLFGLEKGFFEQERLSVEAIAFADAGKVAESLGAGEIQFGAHPMTGMFIFPPAAKGTYHKFVHFGATYGIVEGREYRLYDVVVKNELKGKVNNFKDLEGLKVANTGRLQLEFLTQAIIKDGGDPKEVTVVEMPVARMPGALASGAVDAFHAVSPTPARVLLEGKGFSLGDTYIRVMPSLVVPISAWHTTEDYAKNQPDTVKRFQRAVDRTVDYIKANPEEWYRWASKTLNLPIEVVKYQYVPMLIERYANHPAMGKRGIEGLKALSKVLQDAKVFSGEIDIERLVTLPWDDPWK